ncbi:BQ5605_C008g05315 [Microbotryum silenes-dioicae]|uniref:BQ5605_C008g05315 protein n=1 Tax=Microbotryum silenes-dioicae TaxID=796604 RepID=A0A2X0MZR9_9BASI|nr:BQ5605_C008g05315 [Microbotryum silenes-dioicae]
MLHFRVEAASKTRGPLNLVQSIEHVAVAVTRSPIGKVARPNREMMSLKPSRG